MLDPHLPHFHTNLHASTLTVQLMRLVACRLVSVSMSPLVCGLILVLARLVHTDHNALIHALSSHTVPLPGNEEEQCGGTVVEVVGLWWN